MGKIIIPLSISISKHQILERREMRKEGEGRGEKREERREKREERRGKREERREKREERG